MHNRLFFLGALVLATACSDSNVGNLNSAPEATIEQPSVGTEVLEGTEVSFAGVVEDRGSPLEELEVSWSSSIDGALHDGLADSDGNTAFATADLTVGEHTITLQVRDGLGATGQAAVDLVVRADAAPEITIDSPRAEDVYYSDFPVTLQATVSDSEDLPVDLRVSWAFDGGDTVVEGVIPDSGGTTTNNIDFGADTHSLIATVTDTAGNTRTATVSFVVGPPNTPPDCAITSPADLASAPLGQLVLLEGTASDVDVPSDWLSASFTSSIDDELGEVTPTTAGEIGVAANSLTAGTHTITMSVADEVGGTCTDSIFLTVSTPPSATITTPEATTPLNAGETLTLTGTVSDAEDNDDTLAVSWASDVDGAIGSPSPDSSGAVALNFTLTAGAHLLTLTVTDSAGLTGTDTVQVSVNAAPTAPVVSLQPASPDTLDEITVSIDTAAVDSDGPSVVSYDYTWTRDGAPEAAYTGLDAVPSSATMRDESWEVTVIATDGQAFSDPALASVTVVNSAPSATSAVITPANGNVSSTFTCVASGWSDADGDTEDYTYSWTVNGAPSVTTQAVAGSSLSSGDTLVCTATPFDGSLAGSPVVSAPVVVENSAPSIASVSVTPTTAYTDTMLTANPSGWSDADGDAPSYLYEWFAGSTAVGMDSATLAGSYFSKGETITVQVTPQDASSSGTPVTSSGVIILNTAPTAPGVSISPSAPDDSEDLVCSVSTASTDLDADSVSYSYAWLVNSTATSYAASTLVAAATVDGETWTCEVTPNDGETSGPSGSASVGPLLASCQDDYMLTFSGGNTGTCCCTGGNSGNSYILADVSPNFSNASTATIEFWLYLDTYTQYGSILWSEGTGNSNLSITNTSDCGYGGNRYKTHGSWGGSGTWSSTVAALGAWQHYALVFDSGLVSYFVDGVLQGSSGSTSSTTPNIPNDWLYFGGKTPFSNGNNQHQVNGSYRAIRISSTARYSSNFTPDETLLADSSTMHLYSLDEGAGYLVNDSVDPTMTGTIVNGSNANETWGLYQSCP